MEHKQGYSEFGPIVVRVRLNSVDIPNQEREFSVFGTSRRDYAADRGDIVDIDEFRVYAFDAPDEWEEYEITDLLKPWVRDKVFDAVLSTLTARMTRRVLA